MLTLVGSKLSFRTKMIFANKYFFFNTCNLEFRNLKFPELEVGNLKFPELGKFGIREVRNLFQGIPAPDVPRGHFRLTNGHHEFSVKLHYNINIGLQHYSLVRTIYFSQSSSTNYQVRYEVKNIYFCD